MIPKSLPDPGEFNETSKQIKKIVGDEQLLVLGIDMGGYNIVQPFSYSLKSNKVYHQHYMLKQEDSFTNGYRTTSGIKVDPYREDASEVVVRPAEIIKDPFKYLLLADENVEAGLSIVGALVYCLENRSELGNFEELYTFLMHDNRGNVANFACKRDYDPKKTTDLNTLFKNIAPKKYRAFKKVGLIDLISDRPSPYLSEKRQEKIDKIRSRRQKASNSVLTELVKP